MQFSKWYQLRVLVLQVNDQNIDVILQVFEKLMYKHRIGKHKDFNKVIYYVGMQSVIIIEGHDKFDGV